MYFILGKNPFFERLNYSQIILTLLKNLAFCFKKFRKKPVFLMRGYLHPSRKPSRIQKLHYPASSAGQAVRF